MEPTVPVFVGLAPRQWSQNAMGFFTKDIKTLQDLFLHGLQDLYYAENQIMKSLPAMIDNASNAQLRAGFEKHLAETEGQVHRLRQVFELIDVDPKGEKCPAIDGILKEGRDLISEIDDADVMNVGLIAAAQAVEHYEITRYGALIAWATELGRTDVVPMFKANLAEEKATDQKLTQMAERRVNPKAEKTEKAEAKTDKPKAKPKSTARRKAPKTAARPAAKAKRPAKKARRRA
jgi:ferritin-like metal-binding protein YciE